MNSDIYEAINTFYKLKNKYSKNNNICVNCKNKGGTIFQTNKNILIAKCNANNKCKLNIEIDRGCYKSIFDLNKKLVDMLEKVCKLIIVAKLDLVFDYKSENEITLEFNKLKLEYENITKHINNIINIFHSIIHNNRYKQTIIKLNQDIQLSIIKLKDFHNNLDKNNNKILFSSIVEYYESDIYPLINELRKFKYSTNSLECDSNYCYLIQKSYNYKDTQLQLSKPNIISFRK